MHDRAQPLAPFLQVIQSHRRQRTAGRLQRRRELGGKKPMRHLVVALAMIAGAMGFTFTAASALQTAAAVHNDSAAVR